MTPEATTPTRRPHHAVAHMPATVPIAPSLVALDALLRMVRGLALAPAVALLVLAVQTASAVLARSTRAWCDEPVWPTNRC